MFMTHTFTICILKTNVCYESENIEGRSKLTILAQNQDPSLISRQVIQGQTMVRRMLGGIPEDVRSETGSLLVRSIPLDSARESTFVHCSILWTEAPFTCQGPKETSSFSQVLIHTYSDNICLSLMADRRLGGLSVVQEQSLAYRQVRTWLTAWRGSTPLGLKPLRNPLHTPLSTAGQYRVVEKARTGSVRVGVVSFPSKRAPVFGRSSARARPRARLRLFAWCG